MQDPSSSSGLGRKTSRRRFTKAAVLAPVAGVLSATALSTQPLLARAQTSYVLGLQQAQSTPGAWSLTGSLPAARYGHTATLLPNGQVLLTGGGDSRGVPQVTAYLYDPATSIWTMTGSMQLFRMAHTATLLPNGKVLVVGGFTLTDIAASAELYDPATGAWTTTGSLQTGRADHSATLLTNGQVLVSGGVDNAFPHGPSSLTSAELYDPATGAWTSAGSMQTPRAVHTATLLPNGKVLLAGGSTFDDAKVQGATSSDELYDPATGATGTWASTGPMTTPRAYYTATLLNTGPNAGKVLVVGFAGTSTELYDPTTGTWTPAGSLNTPRDTPTATLLSSGQVLVTDDSSASSELYDPASGTWTVTGSMSATRRYDTATLLPNGQVLVVGGLTSSDNPALASAELFTPPFTPTPIQGSYFGSGITPGKSHSFQMQIQQAGATLTGTLSLDGGPRSALSGSFTTSTAFHLQVTLPTGALLLTGNASISGGLSGSWTLPDGTKGTWTALRFG